MSTSALTQVTAPSVIGTVVDSYNVVISVEACIVVSFYNVVRFYNGAYDTRCSHLRRCGAIAES